MLLFGPTGVGKTSLLLSLARPEWEIVSADSMQVYRFMDIGTAKPGPEIRERLPHHLIDVVDPDVQFSAGEFVRRAEPLIDQVWQRNGVPVVSGGTAFYLKNLAYGLTEAPPSDLRVRRELREEQERLGTGSLFERLQKQDPEYAATIGPADTARVLRALEVVRLTGRPLSSFPVPRKPRGDVELLLIGLYRDREELYSRIEERVDAMLSAGLAEEVAKLREMGYGPEDPGLKAIGYREFFETGPLERVAELIKRDTRRYAKRQMVFFRSLPGVRWYYAEEREAVGSLVRGFLDAGSVSP